MAEQEWEDRAEEVSKLYAIGDGEGGTENTEEVKTFIGTYVKSSLTNVNDTLLHHFRKDDKIVGVWGFHKLNKALQSVPYGTSVKIQYTGGQKIKGRKEPMKTCKVLVPPGTKIANNNLPSPVSRTSVERVPGEDDEVDF